MLVDVEKSLATYLVMVLVMMNDDDDDDAKEAKSYLNFVDFFLNAVGVSY